MEDAERDEHALYELWEGVIAILSLEGSIVQIFFFPLYASPKQLTERGFPPCVCTCATPEYSEEILPRNSEGKDSCWRWGVPTVQSETGEVVGGNQRQEPCGFSGKHAVANGAYSASKKIDQGTEIYSADTEVINEKGTVELADLVFQILAFPSHLLMKIVVRLGAKDDELVLDYFAGTGTTAHGGQSR